MKKMTLWKKMTSWLVVLALLLTLMPAVSAAETAMTISLSSVLKDVKPGEAFTVDVNVTEDSNLGGFDYSIHYNADAVEVVKVAKGEAFKTWSNRVEEEGESAPIWQVNSKIPGEINLSIASTEGMSEKGVLMQVTFKAKADALKVTAGITQTVVSSEQSKGEGNIETTPALKEEDKSFAEEVVVKPEVKSIALKTVPSKVSYITGKEELDVTGGVISVTYTNDAVQEFDLTKAMCSGYDMNKVGTYNVAVTYEGKKLDKGFEITVQDKAITEAVFTAPTSDQNAYLEGKKDQHLDLTGASWAVKYVDGTSDTIAVTEAMCSGYDFNKVGKQAVTVTLPGWKTPATFEINVKAKIITGIAMSSVPVKSNYVVGKDKQLDLTGGAITVSYDNGVNEKINLTADMCSAADLSTVGTKTVDVTYKEFSTSFKVNVKKELSSIKWNTEPTTDYVQGDVFKADGTIDLSYSDGTVEKDIAVTKAMCSGYNLSVAGKQAVKVTYTQAETDTTVAGSKVLNYQIKVTGVYLKAKPTKVNYKVGETFDPTGLLVAFYDGLTDAEKDIAWDSGMLKATGFDSSKAGQQNISLTYVDQNGDTYNLANAFQINVEKVNPAPTPSPSDNGNNGTNGNGQIVQNPTTGMNTTGYLAVFVTLIALSFLVVAKVIRSYRR